MEWISIIKQFIKTPRKVGTITASGPVLTKGMLKNIDWDRCAALVEYGPGTGVFTDEIVKRKRDETLFLVIEQNREFYEKVRMKHQSNPSVKVIHDSAENVCEHLKAHGLDSVDCVISGLPFASLPTSVRQNVFASTKAILAPGGLFVAFQYTTYTMGLFKEFFNRIDVRRVFLNFPPAYVLECSSEPESAA